MKQRQRGKVDGTSDQADDKCSNWLQAAPEEEPSCVLTIRDRVFTQSETTGWAAQLSTSATVVKAERLP